MHLLAIASALFLITSSCALSLDSSVHLARHQQIAARHPVVNRSSVSARCQKRTPPSPSTVASGTRLAASPSSSSPSQHSRPSSSQAPPPSSSQAPPPSSSPSTASVSGKVGIGWSLGDDSAVKNFLTDKVSAFVDFFLCPSSYPYPFSPAYTLGHLLHHNRIPLDCHLLQCYGVQIKLLSSRSLSSPVMHLLLCRSTSKSMAFIFQI